MNLFTNSLVYSCDIELMLASRVTLNSAKTFLEMYNRKFFLATREASYEKMVEVLNENMKKYIKWCYDSVSKSERCLMMAILVASREFRESEERYKQIGMRPLYLLIGEKEPDSEMYKHALEIQEIREDLLTAILGCDDGKEIAAISEYFVNSFSKIYSLNLDQRKRFSQLNNQVENKNKWALKKQELDYINIHGKLSMENINTSLMKIDELLHLIMVGMPKAKKEFELTYLDYTEVITPKVNDEVMREIERIQNSLLACQHLVEEIYYLYKIYSPYECNVLKIPE